MPVVEIPDKNMVIEFPDNMSAGEIEDSILKEVYDTPVMRKAEEPGLIERGKQFVKDRFRGPEPGVGPVSKEDFEAFKVNNPPKLDLSHPDEEVESKTPDKARYGTGLVPDLEGKRGKGRTPLEDIAAQKTETDELSEQLEQTESLVAKTELFAGR